MKKFKLNVVALATLVFGAVIFIACSNEEETVVSNDSLMNYRITDATAFLSEFYNDSWTTGASTIATDSLKSYHVTEIIVGSDTRARGYLVKDNSTGELLHFADVDRTNYEITIVNLINEVSYIEDRINLLPGYGLTDGFDFIKIIGGGGNYDYQTNGYYSYGSCGRNPTTGDCYAGVYYTKTFLGFEGNPRKVMKGLSQVYVACDCTTMTRIGDYVPDGTEWLQ